MDLQETEGERRCHHNNSRIEMLAAEVSPGFPRLSVLCLSLSHSAVPGAPSPEHLRPTQVAFCTDLGSRHASFGSVTSPGLPRFGRAAMTDMPGRVSRVQFPLDTREGVAVPYLVPGM